MEDVMDHIWIGYNIITQCVEFGWTVQISPPLSIQHACLEVLNNSCNNLRADCLLSERSELGMPGRSLLIRVNTMVQIDALDSITSEGSRQELLIRNWTDRILVLTLLFYLCLSSTHTHTLFLSLSVLLHLVHHKSVCVCVCVEESWIVGGVPPSILSFQRKHGEYLTPCPMAPPSLCLIVVSSKITLLLKWSHAHEWYYGACLIVCAQIGRASCRERV